MSVCKGFTVVMSANKHSGPVEHFESPDWTFSFQQTTPIPSYLIAIGAGNLDHKSIGPRSTIWCEPEVLEAAAWEFADAETFIRIGEELTTPYVWDRYDILLLPPSFPYGGMENPCLTFLTPSLLAGDRSLVDVLAHEIAHSWTGNLVTAANWEHFWLNEGFTMFLERKIIGRLHGESVRQFSSICGLTDLRDAVDQFGFEHAATKLRPDLSATDPDDVFSSIPYEKGHTFLAFLEELVGGPAVFEPFFKAHIIEFAGKSITTDDFIKFFESYFSVQNIKVQVDWDAWLNGPGLPPSFPNYNRSLMLPCENLLTSLLQSTEEIGSQSANMTAAFTSLNLDQKLVFLDLLAKSPALSPLHIRTLEFDFGLSQERNVEICLRWFLLALRAGYTAVVPSALTFITQHGRMKYNRPIYRALFKLGGEFREAARETFTQNRKFYHPIAANMIEKDLQY